MEEAQDAVGRGLGRAGRRADAEASHVDLHLAAQDVGHQLARQDHARVGAPTTRRVLLVLPDEAGRAGHGPEVEEDERSGGAHRDPLELVVRPIRLDVVHPHEPAVLGVADHESIAARLHRRVAERHVVRHRPERAGLGDRDHADLPRDEVPPELQAPVGLPVGVLGHLALAAAARALVQDGEGVVVRGDYLNRRAVHREPPLALADVEQHAVHALLRAGARVEVEREDLVHGGGAVVDHHLAAEAVRVTEGRRDQDGGTGLPPALVGDGLEDGALEVCERHREEGRLRRADQDGREPQVLTADPEGENHEPLPGEPTQHLRPKVRERSAEAVPEARLVRGPGVPDHQRVGVAAAHVRVGVVDRHPVAHPHHLGLDDGLTVGQVEHDLVPIAPLFPEGQFHEVLTPGGVDDFRRARNRSADLGRHAGQGLQERSRRRGSSVRRGVHGGPLRWGAPPPDRTTLGARPGARGRGSVLRYAKRISCNCDRGWAQRVSRENRSRGPRQRARRLATAGSRCDGRRVILAERCAAVPRPLAPPAPVRDWTEPRWGCGQPGRSDHDRRGATA